MANSLQSSHRTVLSGTIVVAGILALATLLQSYIYVVFPTDIYLPIHYFAEIASIVVSFSIFAVYWNATKEVRNAQGLLIGTAFLTVAAIDAMHTLSFPGMPDFVTASSVEKGIYYWLAARMWAAFALLVAVFVNPLTRNPLLSRWTLLTLAIVVMILVFVAVSFFSVYLPPMFVAGQGLTPLKIALEYLVAGMSAVAALLYLKAYKTSSDKFCQLLSMALIITTFSELSFTLYAAAYDIYNLLGHVYKVVAYYLIFQALLVSAVRRPHAELKAALAALDDKNQELEELNDQIENQLKRTIVELQQTADVASQRAAQLDAIIDNLTEGVVIADSKGLLLRYNPAALAMAGFKSQIEVPPCLEGLSVLRFFHPDGRLIPMDEWPISRAIKGERFVDYEVVLVGNDCIQRNLVYSGAPIQDEGGEIVLSVTVSRDVTEERELSRMKDEFFLIASHHLKTPLTSVKGYAQLLTRKIARAAGHDEEMKGLEIITSQVDVMHRMIEKLLDVTRIQSRRFDLNKEVFDLSEMVGDIVQDFRAVNEARTLSMNTNGTVTVDGDRRRMQEVVTNLILNAIRYSPENSPVEVSVEKRDGCAWITIRDYGIGIPKDRQRFIFQQFYRAAPTPYSEGMGLGLYITRGIIEAHGGQIWFESPPRGGNGEQEIGSVFYVSLPME